MINCPKLVFWYLIVVAGPDEDAENVFRISFRCECNGSSIRWLDPFAQI